MHFYSYGLLIHKMGLFVQQLNIKPPVLTINRLAKSLDSPKNAVCCGMMKYTPMCTLLSKISRANLLIPKMMIKPSSTV